MRLFLDHKTHRIKLAYRKREEVAKMEHQSLYVIDNSSEDQTVKKYLTEWCQVSKQMDVATGYLEIGGLLDLDQSWQKLDKIRIILGNEMTKRTRNVIDSVVTAMLTRLKDSVDDEQEHNEFLIGVHAIVEAMKSGKIECRVYDTHRFHAIHEFAGWVCSCWF